MHTYYKKVILFIITLVCFLQGRVIHAFIPLYDSNKNNIVTQQTSLKYQPYLQLGGIKFFNMERANVGVGADLFVPLWQLPNNLIFADLRFYDRSGQPFEGNIHLGYRQLSVDQQQMFGVYGAFDRKKSWYGNYFNQLTFGGEYFIGKWFLGGNIYCPIGIKEKSVDVGPSFWQLRQVGIYKNIWQIQNRVTEKSMFGADIELGYEVIHGLTAYLGGYYFKTSNADVVAGPRARLKYDCYFKSGKKILGVLDKIGIESGVERDNPRGTVWYLSANFRIGLLPNKDHSVLSSMERHMIDLVHRDVDIVTSSIIKPPIETAYTDENGKIVNLREVKNAMEYQEALQDPNANVISIVQHEGEGVAIFNHNETNHSHKIVIKPTRSEMNNPHTIMSFIHEGRKKIKNGVPQIQGTASPDNLKDIKPKKNEFSGKQPDDPVITKPQVGFQNGEHSENQRNSGVQKGIPSGNSNLDLENVPKETKVAYRNQSANSEEQEDLKWGSISRYADEAHRCQVSAIGNNS